MENSWIVYLGLGVFTGCSRNQPKTYTTNSDVLLKTLSSCFLVLNVIPLTSEKINYKIQRNIIQIYKTKIDLKHKKI